MRMFPFPECYYYNVYTQECAKQLAYNMLTAVLILIVASVILWFEYKKLKKDESNTSIKGRA